MIVGVSGKLCKTFPHKVASMNAESAFTPYFKTSVRSVKKEVVVEEGSRMNEPEVSHREVVSSASSSQSKPFDYTVEKLLEASSSETSKVSSAGSPSRSEVSSSSTSLGILARHLWWYHSQNLGHNKPLSSMSSSSSGSPSFIPSLTESLSSIPETMCEFHLTAFCQHVLKKKFLLPFKGVHCL